MVILAFIIKTQNVPPISLMSNVLRLFCMTVEFAEGMAKFSADFQEAACYRVKCKWLLLRLRIPILFFENDQ